MQVVGNQCIVHGLQSAGGQALNGKYVTIVKVAENARFFHCKFHDGSLRNIKPMNLSTLSPLSNPAHLSQLVLQLRSQLRPPSSGAGGSTVHLLALPVQAVIAQFTEPLRVKDTTVANLKKCFEEADAARAALEQAQQIIRDHKNDDPEGPTLTQLVNQRNNARATLVAALTD